MSGLVFWRRSVPSEPPGPPLEGRFQGHWHPETLVCAFRGHAAPAAHARVADTQDWLIALPIDEHGHVARCLRCDAWVIADPDQAEQDRVAPLSAYSVPQRGSALRDATILKLISVDRGLHSIVFFLVATGILIVESNLRVLQSFADRLYRDSTSTLSGTGQGASSSYFGRHLQSFTHLQKHSLILLFWVAVAYGVIEGIEAVGLWRQRRWAEYLTVIATGGFLPLEIHEVMDGITFIRVGALVINVAVLVYLVYAKHLFGFRGGSLANDLAFSAAEVIQPLPGQPILGSAPLRLSSPETKPESKDSAGG